MSYQTPEEQKTLLSKLKDNYSSRFGNFALTSTIQRASTYKDRDGTEPTETLIHNAFVKYFDSQHQSYPEWLGVPTKQVNQQQQQQKSAYSSYQPVYTNYNQGQGQGQSQGHSQQGNNQQGNRQGNNQPNNQVQYQNQSSSRTNENQDQRPTSAGYQPRSSSRLQDMYNKSKQQHVPGGGYTTVNQPNRSNSSNGSTSGTRLREKMMTSNSMTGMSNIVNENGGKKPTWGKR